MLEPWASVFEAFRLWAVAGKGRKKMSPASVMDKRIVLFPCTGENKKFGDGKARSEVFFYL
jgi:hypothetical protein